MSGAISTATGQMQLLWEPERRVFAVNELNGAVQGLFETEFRGIFVAGEISGCRMASSGHFYFYLKDQQSQLKCVLFKGTARYSKFKPQEGLAVIARGSLEVYEARGEYQLIVESLEPQGVGALQIAFEQLKKQLAAEGLFDAVRKRPLPKLPRRIGIVTSASGAVIRDILHVLERRFRGLHIRLFPAQVQGDGATEQVCAGLRHFSEGGWPQVVILARGGGSIEDLWTFNTEAVARAIATSRVPIISAIGHETDFTISDFVADQRAPTPSAAAEVVICTKDSLLEQVQADKGKALQAIRYRLLICSRNLHQRGTDRAARVIQRRISSAVQQVDSLEERLQFWRRAAMQEHSKRLSNLTVRLRATDLQLRFSRGGHQSELLCQRLIKSIETHMWRARSRQQSLRLHLAQLSPLAVLDRGYAILESSSGQIVRAAADTSPGDRLKARVSRGEFEVVVIPGKQSP